jgi:hypothetical protein
MNYKNINVYIPKIDNNITKINLTNMFNTMFKEHCIKNIVFIKNKKTNNDMAYVYFKYWPSTKFSNCVKNKLLNNENIKIVYNYPNYFKCLLKK